jgi:hypothetical protein
LPQRLATRVERRFDGVLAAIDRRTGGLALVRRQFGQTLEQLGHLAVLAEVSGLDLLQRIRVVGRRKGGRRGVDYLIEVVHGIHRKKGGLRLLS